MPVRLDDVRRAVASRPKQHADAPRHAAVAAIVYPDDEDVLRLVFMLRSEYEGDPWSGHVAFPGGRVEPHDESPRHAAVRETFEEVGVDLSGAEPIGDLDVVAPVSGLVALAIHPFVFALDRAPDYRLNDEVRSIHTTTLDALLAGEGRGPFTYTWRGQEVVLPRVDFDGVRLWGLTLRVVDDLLDRLDGKGLGLDRQSR